MAALTRPLGDAISTIYGADLYLTKKDLKRMKVGDRYEVLCEDALHYMVEVKELHIVGGGGGSSSNSLYGKLHFNRWNRKFDYTGFLHALYIAPMNTFSKGMLNIGTNQYPPSWRTQLRTGAVAEVVEDPVNRRSLKRPVESEDDNNNREKLPSRPASRVDSSPLAAAPVPSHVALSSGSKHPPQSSKPRPVVSTSNLSLRSGGSTHGHQQQQSGRGFFKSKSSKVVKVKVRAIRPLLAAPRTRSLMESGRRNTMISLKHGQNVPASSSMVHVDAGIIIEDREEGGTIDDKGSIGIPEQQQEPPPSSLPASSRRLVPQNPNPSSDTTTTTAVVAPSLGTDAPRNRVGRPPMKQKQKQRTPLPIPRPDAAVLLTDSPNQQPTQLSDHHHHHQTIDADAATAANPPIPESGVRIKETPSTAAAAGSRRKPKVTFVLTNNYQGSNNNNTTTTTEVSSPSRTAPSAAPDRVPAVHPARAAAASDHASLLRTRTCYPAGYLDKPRLFTGSKRRRYSQYEEEEEEEATLTQSSTTQSSTTQLSLEQPELKTSLEASPPDRSPDDLEARGEAQSVGPSVSSPSSTSDGRRDPPPVRHRDTLQAINWVAETGLHASRPIFGPVSMLLHHRTVLLDDPSLTAVLEDLLPAQALLSFLVTCRADETYYRRKFKQMKIANAVHLVDDAKQPVDDAKQPVGLSRPVPLQLSEDVQLSAMGETTSSGTGSSSSRDWTRQLLVDKLFPPPLHDDNGDDDEDESVGRADSLLRSFLCAKFGFHRVVWVEELHPGVPKSYLFFSSSSSSSKEGLGQGPSPPTRPITLYCKTKPAACPIVSYTCPIVCKYTSTRPPPDYSQLHRLFSEARMQSRVVFNCTLLPRTREDSLLCSMDSLLTGSGNKAVSAVTSLRNGQERSSSSSLVEVVYPSMVEVSSRVTSTTRSVPVSMKEEEEELEGKASTSIPSQSSQPIRYSEELLPIPVVTCRESQPGFWFPANASGYRGISALCKDWVDELSTHSDDGWFLPLSSLVHPPDSSSCPGVTPLQVGCLSLRNSRPWSARRGDLYESIVEKAALLVTDASLHPPNCQLFVAFQSGEAYLQWKGAVPVFPDYPIDVPPQTWVALRVADVYALRRRTTTIRATTTTTTTGGGISSSSFHLIRRGDALVWLPPQSDDLGAEQQPPVDQPSMESMESTSDDLHIDEEASAARVESTVLFCDPNPLEIQETHPIDRVVRCLGIDRIAQTHREAIDAFRQMQPALEARDVRAPHLLLLLSAQLELAEATKMMLDHLHLQRHEQ